MRPKTRQVVSAAVLALLVGCSSGGETIAVPTLQSTLVPEVSSSETPEPFAASATPTTSDSISRPVEATTLASELLLSAAKSAGFAAELGEAPFGDFASIYIDSASTQFVFGYLPSAWDVQVFGAWKHVGAYEIYEDCDELVILLVDTEGGVGLQPLRLLLPHLGCQEVSENSG